MTSRAIGCARRYDVTATADGVVTRAASSRTDDGIRRQDARGRLKERFVAHVCSDAVLRHVNCLHSCRPLLAPRCDADDIIYVTVAVSAYELSS